VVGLDTVGHLSCGIETDTVVGAVDLRSHICFPLLRSLEDILAARAKHRREVAQPDVGRQIQQPRISSRSNESCFDAEHWVGCAPVVAFDLVFFESNAKADSELPNPLRRVSQRKLARTNFDN
jgi:hypothetical protein